MYSGFDLLSVPVSLTICAIVAGAGPVILRPLLRRAGVVDVPNERSSHSAVVIRGGGLAPLCAIVLGAVFAPTSAPLWILIGLGAAAGLLGFVDDVRSLSARVRFAAQIVLGACLGSLVVIVSGSAWWALPVVTILFAASVNMVNFMDGINAISSLYGAVVGGSFVVLGVVLSIEWLAVSGALTGIAFLLFLPWNLFGSRMFLGDSGSYLLGALTVSMAVFAVAAGVPWPSAFAPFAIYATDTAFAIGGRLIRGERVWEAHRMHQYQQLVDSGLPHLSVAAYVAVFSLCATAAGAIALAGSPISFLIAVGLVLLCCAVYVLLSQLVTRSMRRKAS